MAHRIVENVHSRRFTRIGLTCLTLTCLTLGQAAAAFPNEPEKTAPLAPAPLYQDLNNLGCADPEIVWNAHEEQWWIFYNARRVLEDDVNAGTPVGVISSTDWKTWTFRGYCTLDGVGPVRSETGRSMVAPYTCWAPAIIRDGDVYHLFVTYSDTNEGFWGGQEKVIRHYVAAADDLLTGWTAAEIDTPITTPGAIDAGLFKKGQTWQMYFRAHDPVTRKSNGAPLSRTFLAESDDLNEWTVLGPVPGDINDRKRVHHVAPKSLRPVSADDAGAETVRFGYMEAQYPFYWAGRYWLSTDSQLWASDDGHDWAYAGDFLDDRTSTRPMDNTRGRHASFAVIGDRCFAFYHVEPLRQYGIPYAKNPPNQRVNYLQMIEIVDDNGVLSYDRSASVELPMALRPDNEYWGQAAPE